MRSAVFVACAVWFVSCGGSDPNPDGLGGPVDVGATVRAALVAADTSPPPDHPTYTADHFTLSLSANQSVTIVMCRCATDLDPFLEFSSGATVISTDDDSAGNRGARIEFTAPASGTYDVWARDCCREPIPADGQPRRYFLRTVGGLQDLLSCPDAPDSNCS